MPIGLIFKFKKSAFKFAKKYLYSTSKHSTTKEFFSKKYPDKDKIFPLKSFLFLLSFCHISSTIFSFFSLILSFFAKSFIFILSVFVMQIEPNCLYKTKSKIWVMQDIYIYIFKVCFSIKDDIHTSIFCWNSTI